MEDNDDDEDDPSYDLTRQVAPEIGIVHMVLNSVLQLRPSKSLKNKYLIMYLPGSQL